MPYMIVEKDGKFCVHKEGTDKKPKGDSLHCYDEKEKANSYMKALYANTKDASELSESLTEKIRAIHDAFGGKFNQYNPTPYCYVREVYDDHIIVEQGEDLYKVTYTKSGETVTFAERDKWEEVKLAYVTLGEKITNFFNKMFSKQEKKVHETFEFSFTDLGSMSLEDPIGLKYIDGMAAGTFTAMSGEEVTFAVDELEDYVANTQKVIESTRTEGGEVVGLPIDKNGHDHVGGAGWIVGLELDKTRSVIRFLVNWTNEGIELIKANSRRFFSPSVDTEGMYIRGGSLTNWPATRLSTGELLLRPVELSETIQEIDMEKTLAQMLEDLKKTIVDAVSAKPDPTPPATTELQEGSGVSPALQELLGSSEAVEELGRRATEIAQDAIKAEKRKIHAVEFAARIVGGTKEKPFGLAVRPQDIVALLLSLPEKQSRAVEKILEKTLDAAVDFSEHGVDSMGYLQKPKLPASYRPYVTKWIEAGKPMSEFFAANPEVGEVEDFDLSEFAKKE
jgi:hypothetical protein